MRRLLYLLMPISFLVFASCSKDEFTEEDILKLEQQTDLSVIVYEPEVISNSRKPIEGATVTVIFGGESLTALTSALSGQARFSNIGIGTIIIEVKKDGYIPEIKTIAVEAPYRTNDRTIQIALNQITPSPLSSMTIRGNVRIQTDLTNAITEVPVDAVVRVYDYYDYHNHSGNTAPLTTTKIDAQGNYVLNVPLKEYGRYLYLVFPILELDQKLYVLKEAVPTLVTAKTIFDPTLGATSIPVVISNIGAISPAGFEWPNSSNLSTYVYVERGNNLTVNPNYGTGSSRVIP